MRQRSKRRDAQAIAHHYDVSNDFYALFLDPLSCFRTPVKSYYMPLRRQAVAQAVPATDPVYPGYSYSDAGLGASGRSHGHD